MHQRLVIAVFVAGRKLQVVVEKQAHVILPARDDDALVGRGFGMDNLVSVKLRFGQRGQLPRPDETGDQRCHRDEGLRFEAGYAAQLFAEQPQRPSRHQHVEQTEEQAAAHQSDVRHQQQRKKDGNRQRAEIVEGQHLRDDFLERQVTFHDAHDQRNFQADQRADAEYGQVERQLERCGKPDEEEKQSGCRKTADNADQQFDLDKARHQVAGNVA